MGSATRNLSLALQQCDIKHNMDARSKLVSERRGAAGPKVPWYLSTVRLLLCAALRSTQPSLIELRQLSRGLFKFHTVWHQALVNYVSAAGTVRDCHALPASLSGTGGAAAQHGQLHVPADAGCRAHRL